MVARSAPSRGRKPATQARWDSVRTLSSPSPRVGATCLTRGFGICWPLTPPVPLSAEPGWSLLPLPTSRPHDAASSSRLSLVLSGLIGAVTTVPVIGFLLSPLTRKQPAGVAPGRARRGLHGRRDRERRLRGRVATAVGRRDRSHGGVAPPRRLGRASPRSRCTAPTLVVRCAGWPTRSCSSVPATVVCTTVTAPSPAAHRRARCRSIRCGCATARSRS